MPVRPRSVVERILDKIEITDEGCWRFTGVTIYGYGRISVPPSRSELVHRELYAHLCGPIPEGMDLDHLCHNEAVARGECRGGVGCAHRACCNPEHLRPATRLENVAGANVIECGSFQRAKTHCPQGHPYEGDNVRLKTRSDGTCRGRSCRQCTRDYATRRRQERRAS